MTPNINMSALALPLLIYLAQTYQNTGDSGRRQAASLRLSSFRRTRSALGQTSTRTIDVCETDLQTPWGCKDINQVISLSCHSPISASKPSGRGSPVLVAEKKQSDVTSHALNPEKCQGYQHVAIDSFCLAGRSALA